MKHTGVLAALVIAIDQSMAGFTNSFDGITSGSTVPLTWDGVQPQHYPLCITAQVIGKKSGDGFRADAYRVNITTGASGTSYAWTGAPYPLRWIPRGLYQLELRPLSWAGPDVPLLAKSPFFSVSEPGTAAGAGGSASPQPAPAEPQSGDSGISKPVAIGVGVAIGVPSVVATAILAWCFRKRQRRAAMEKRRLKRHEFVIS